MRKDDISNLRLAKYDFWSLSFFILWNKLYTKVLSIIIHYMNPKHAQKLSIIPPALVKCDFMCDVAGMGLFKFRNIQYLAYFLHCTLMLSTVHHFKRDVVIPSFVLEWGGGVKRRWLKRPRHEKSLFESTKCNELSWHDVQ